MLERRFYLMTDLESDSQAATYFVISPMSMYNIPRQTWYRLAWKPEPLIGESAYPVSPIGNFVPSGRKLIL